VVCFLEEGWVAVRRKKEEEVVVSARRRCVNTGDRERRRKEGMSCLMGIGRP